MIDYPELEQARRTYGNRNQILVAMEELNELAAVLAKYPRYTHEDDAVRDLKDKVLDETADVLVVLEHVKAVFGLTQKEIDERTDKKVARLRRWLKNSPSMEQTVKDRDV